MTGRSAICSSWELLITVVGVAGLRVVGTSEENWVLGIDREVVMLAIFEVSAVATVGGLPLTFLFLLTVTKPSLSWLGSGWLRPRTRPLCLESNWPRPVGCLSPLVVPAPCRAMDVHGTVALLASARRAGLLVWVVAHPAAVYLMACLATPSTPSDAPAVPG